MNTLFALIALAGCASASFNTDNLFPIAMTSGFTTAPSGTGPSLLSHVALDDDALEVTNVTRGLSHNVVAAPNAPANTQAWEAVYPFGSWNPSESGTRGGFGFYFAGPDGFDVTSATEILFSYAVFFPKGFQFNMGGKLPGPYGGTTDALAKGCSGGRQQDRAACFDLRLMWRTDGAGEIYAYLPEVPANDVLNELAGTVTDDTFGTSIARGAYSFATNGWTVVAQRVQLNTPGVVPPDGELELFVNGKSVIHATQVQIRNSSDNVFRGVHAQTFFGGDDESWGSPVNQTSYFADMTLGIVQQGASPAEGKAPYPLSAARVSHHAAPILAAVVTIVIVFVLA